MIRVHVEVAKSIKIAMELVNKKQRYMNGRKLSLTLCLSILCFFSVWSQEKEGKVEVIQDSMITILQQRRIAFENNPAGSAEQKSGIKGTVLGFRVQIYTGTSRDDAYAAQAEFKNMYSDINTYISYTQPNYRVKVGDFKSRREAEAMMHELRKSFNSVFLFTEQVNVIY